MRKYLEKIPDPIKVAIAGIGIGIGTAGLLCATYAKPVAAEQASFPVKSVSIERNSGRRFLPPPRNSYKKDGKTLVNPDLCAVIKKTDNGDIYFGGFFITQDGDFDYIMIKTRAGKFFGYPGKEICVGFTDEEIISNNARFMTCGIDYDYKSKKPIAIDCSTGMIDVEQIPEDIIDSLKEKQIRKAD